MKSSMIYLISCHSKCGNVSRTFGYYNNKIDALDAIRKNIGSLNESGYYDYLVLEEAESGIFPQTKVIQWYKWNNKWEKCKSPKWSIGVINFGIG